LVSKNGGLAVDGFEIPFVTLVGEGSCEVVIAWLCGGVNLSW
jgi:hypothetical protein